MKKKDLTKIMLDKVNEISAWCPESASLFFRAYKEAFTTIDDVDEHRCSLYGKAYYIRNCVKSIIRSGCVSGMALCYKVNDISYELMDAIDDFAEDYETGESF